MFELAAPQPPSPVKKGRRRKRPNIAFILPCSIFTTLRNIGVKDNVLAEALGIPRPTITRVCAGISPDLSLSCEEFARLKAFAARKLAEAQEAAAMLGLA